MNKTLLFLLVTLIQSQSNGVLLSGPNHTNKFNENVEDFQLEDWDNSESSSTSDISKIFHDKLHLYQKRSGNDVLTRRSILDKNFMRFGRASEHNCPEKNCRTIRSSFYQPNEKQDFLRYSRGMRDNFIRFGRSARDNFIRFGRGARDNFIRFGRDGQEGFVAIPSEEFSRIGKSPRDSFIRFGRGDMDSFIRFGKLDQNFIRFGRNSDKKLTSRDYEEGTPDKEDPYEEAGTGWTKVRGTLVKQQNEDEIDDKQSDFGEENKDSDMVVRKKRKVTEGDDDPTKTNTNNKKDDKMEKQRMSSPEKVDESTVRAGRDSSGHKVLSRRSTAYFDRVPGFFPQNFPPRIQYVKTWDDLENRKNYYNPLYPPFFPVSSTF